MMEVDDVVVDADEDGDVDECEPTAADAADDDWVDREAIFDD